jgi:hypothetical protein
MNTNQTLSGETKQKIADQLRTYVQNVAGGSANRASKMLKNVSNAYVSNMLNGKWEAISDDAWRNVQKQVALRDGEWAVTDTEPSVSLEFFFRDAMDHANVFGLIGDAGCGKTHTAERFAVRDNVYLVSCNEFYNRRSFLSELLRVMGRDSGGYTVSEMMQQVIMHVRRVDSPLIILDEADKLSDQVLYFFISLYNSLEGKCGIILMATDFLEKRIMKGLKLNRKGYKEIYSRLGRKFITLPVPTAADITLMVATNGIRDAVETRRIINESEGDLRRVKRLVHAARRREADHG